MKKSFTFLAMVIAILSFTTAFSQDQSIENEGVNIYFQEFGSGEPILIIGGGPGDASERYIALCELLSTNFRCILVDQRGAGKSIPDVLDSTTINLNLTIDDFEVIRESLKLKNWTILGFSYGGYLASYYAYHYPQSISKIIFLSSMGLNTNAFGHFLDNIVSRLNADDMMKVAYWSDKTRVAQNRDKAIFEIIKARMPGYFYDREKSLLVTETMQPSHFNLNLEQFIWNDIKNFNLEEKENKFNNPAIVLTGRQDPLGEGVAISIHNYYKNSELVFIEKAGHYTWFEQPEKVLSEITNFMNKNK